MKIIECNVPIFGFPCYAVRGGFTRSKMRIKMGSSDLGELYEAFRGPITIIHHQDRFHTDRSEFRCISAISINWEGTLT